VENMAFLIVRCKSCAGIKWALVRGNKQDALVGRDNILRAVAVMHIEVDDGYALEIMVLQGMEGANRDIVKQAKAHRLLARGVMPGRPDGAESPFIFTR